MAGDDLKYIIGIYDSKTGEKVDIGVGPTPGDAGLSAKGKVANDPRYPDQLKIDKCVLVFPEGTPGAPARSLVDAEEQATRSGFLGG
jgi:hypothetical protein